MRRRRICFVTGTRAEFGLMQTTLRAIAAHPALSLQIIATGMHLDPAHGAGLRSIREQGWTIDAVVAWPRGGDSDLTQRATSTGNAVAKMAVQFKKLQSDVVLVVGDRVEAFAGATAGQLSGRIVAHVHGGDRAAGQVDDCLRHAISKMAHVHFPATTLSRKRLVRMGEDPWRIFSCGSPGVDGIVDAVMTFEGAPTGAFALVVYHPVDPDDRIEERRMSDILREAVRPLGRAVVIYPNNDPGSAGVRRAIERRGDDARFVVRRDVPRGQFLGLMRDAAFMIGNSSSGIIEAASFGLPVIDAGERQQGREHGTNVMHVGNEPAAIARSVARLSADQFRRYPKRNVYGGQNVGTKIANALADLVIDSRLRQKLIAY